MVNNVSNTITIWEYRFKTEQELIKEFGEEWFHLPSVFWFWGDNMIEFLGKDFELDYDKNIIINPEFDNVPHFHYKNFYITTEVLVKNDTTHNINYNKQRQLVYENLGYKRNIVLYKCESVEKNMELKKWIDRELGLSVNLFDVDSTGFILINNKMSMSIKGVSNFEETESYFRRNSDKGYIVSVCNSVEEIKHKFKFDSKYHYNKQKELVYEKLEDYVKYVILYKCDNPLEEERLNNYYKSIGYNHNNNRWIGDGVNYSVLKKNGKDYELFNVKTPLSIEEIQEIYEQDGNHFFYCDSLFELKKLINGVLDSKLMYNEPKKLVYEKKIFKFSEYKKGDN